MLTYAKLAGAFISRKKCPVIKGTWWISNHPWLSRLKSSLERKERKTNLFFAKETFQEFVCNSNVIQFKVLFLKLQKTKLNQQLGSFNNADDLAYGKRSYRNESIFINLSKRAQATVDSGNSKRLNSKQSLISKRFCLMTPIVL